MKNIQLETDNVIKPLISVIMASYNGENTIIDAINSIKNQTYKNIEFIIVDDCSNNNLESFLNNKIDIKKIKIIRNPLNLGLAASLNIGINASSGILIARMDDDDYSISTRIETQEDFMRKNPDISLLGTAISLYDRNLNFIRNYFFPLDHSEISKYMCRGNPLAHPTVMFTRDFYIRSGGYNPRFRRIEDLELWGRMISTSKYANLPDVLLRHRVRFTKTLAVVPLSVYIRLRNSICLKCFMISLPWVLIYVAIEFARHFGYKQKAVRISSGLIQDNKFFNQP